jgi:hypothetical protein
MSGLILMGGLVIALNSGSPQTRYSQRSSSGESESPESSVFDGFWIPDQVRDDEPVRYDVNEGAIRVAEIRPAIHETRALGFHTEIRDREFPDRSQVPFSVRI